MCLEKMSERIIIVVIIGVEERRQIEMNVTLNNTSNLRHKRF